MNIKFYGVHDLSSGWHLKEIEEFFQHWNEKIHDPDLNTILELYNIKKYMDAGMQHLDGAMSNFRDIRISVKLPPKFWADILVGFRMQTCRNFIRK